MTTSSPVSGPAPRLLLGDSGGRKTVLDGGWWPRSTDPETELPGLVLAIDGIRKPITGLILSSRAWTGRPRRLGVGNRVLKLNFFASQPDALLIAMCGPDTRVDLLVVPPNTEPATARAAMAMAATTRNLIQAQDVMATVNAAATNSERVFAEGEAAATAQLDSEADEAWETEGGFHSWVGAPSR